MEQLSQYLETFNWFTLRSMFYVVTPGETTYADVRDVPDYLDAAVPWMLVLIVLEFVFDPDRYAVNDTITSINAGIASLTFKFSGKTLSAALYPTVWSYVHLVNADLSATWWCISFLTQDLAYYFAHRAVHEAGVFWSFHQMHHSSEYYNLSTALRQGAIQDLGTGLFDLAQALIIPPQLFYAHKSLNVLYQFWLHTEHVPHLGPLEYVFNTPSSHRVHHGRNPYCIDKNYGATLIVWDRLFGTYAQEKTEEPVVYGLVSPVNTFDQFKLQFFEFKELGYDKGQMKNDKGEELFPGFWNKLKAALYPPGYFAGVSTKQFFLWRCLTDSEDGIPQVDRQTVVRFNPQIPIERMVYLIVQGFFFIYCALPYVRERPRMGYFEAAAKLFSIFGMLQMFGYYFDNEDVVFAVTFDVVRTLYMIAISSCFDEQFEVVFCSTMLAFSLVVQCLSFWFRPPSKKRMD